MINLGFPGGSNGEESACNARDPVLTPGLGRSHGGGNDNPLQYSCLDNPTDRGAWGARVCGVRKSQTQLSTHTHTVLYSIQNTPISLSNFLTVLWDRVSLVNPIPHMRNRLMGLGLFVWSHVNKNWQDSVSPLSCVSCQRHKTLCVSKTMPFLLQHIT